MEEVGAQIANPMFIPQLLPPSMPKKRDFARQNPGFSPNPSGPSWNPKLYDWDSLRFAVRPTSNGAEGSKDLNLRKSLEEDGEGLTLKLGVAEEDRAVVRPTKKVRAGSPGNGGGDGGGGGSYPMCQVDDCKVDLSNAKDYHRRHKVCEVHSKMTKAIVGNQMQRFCQQCSRFHPLSEFDEGKRSCRRRLAGHNRRRRKTQPEETPSKLLPPANTNQGSSGNDNLDIVKLLTVLARLQGNDADKVAGIPSVPDKPHVNQILSKIHALRTATSATRSSVPGCFDLNISQVSEQPPSEQSRNPSTMKFLPVLSQASKDRNGSNKSKVVFPSIGSERKQCTLQSQLEFSKDPIQKSQPSFPLQLFSSTADDSPPKVGSFRKYLSSESSNPMDDASPSSSPPFEEKHERMSVCRGDMTRRSHGRIAPVDFFKESEMRVENAAMLNHQSQASYTSSTGSDHSPSSSNSDGQDRTGRISFKLFDKDPSNIPGALRSQILNWLSNSPSEMESYIRPGCVVLSIYASMPSGVWDELEKNLLQKVSSLAQSESDFWGNGRFLIQTNGQLAIYNDGKARLCKSWKTWRTPEITSVSPIAVVSGQEMSFVLRGHNLTAPGTRIHCTFMGGYVSKEVSASAYPGTIYDSSTVENFNFHTGSPDTFGRCFIEVENGFKGHSFPVIIADATICQELRVLESDFEGDSSRDSIDENQVGPRSREDVLHFLNELGWLFQRKNIASNSHLGNYSTCRFNFLLTFSVERDWVAVVERILDLLVQKSVNEDDNLIQESLGMLLEIQLLNRAVKRKCRKMVDLLLNYSVKGSSNESKIYLFPPNMAGPCGLTPLHIAASTQNSEDMVKALIDDPQEIGLKSWNSVFDENDQTPHMYASIRNNHSYNELVARKLSDKKNSQITILIENQENAISRAIGVKFCSHCAAMGARRFRPVHRTQGFLYRPYMHSLLVIAAVCVCVCLLMRGMPKVSDIAPFMWENLDYGPR